MLAARFARRCEPLRSTLQVARRYQVGAPPRRKAPVKKAIKGGEGDAAAAAAAPGHGGGGAAKGALGKYKDLVRKYGMPLAIYYFLFNESIVLTITYLLTYDYLGAGDIVSVIKSIEAAVAEKSGVQLSMTPDAKTMDRTIEFGPVVITARCATNFGLASAFMSLFTAVQIPFCIATLPHMTKVARGVRGLFPRRAPKAAAAEKGAAKAGSKKA
jgi:hypothetical protein